METDFKTEEQVLMRDYTVIVVVRIVRKQRNGTYTVRDLHGAITCNVQATDLIRRRHRRSYSTVRA